MYIHVHLTLLPANAAALLSPHDLDYISHTSLIASRVPSAISLSSYLSKLRTPTIPLSPLLPQPASSSIITVLTEAPRTSRRQRRARLLHNPAGQTGRPGSVAVLGDDLHAVGDHPRRLVRLILQLRRRLVAREGVVHIRDVDDGEFRGVVAPEERGPLVQALGDEGRDGGDDRHLGQARIEALHVRRQDLGPVGEVGRRVGGVVVHEDDVHPARGLQQREDRVVLQRFAAIDEK